MATGSPYAAQPPQPPVQKSNTGTILAIVFGSLLLAALICGGVLFLLLMPAVSSARHAARRMQSSNNLKQIGVALHNYHDTFGAFPAAYSTDADGQPLLSWRVTLLPFLETGPLYNEFRLDEPWDSPHNRPLADRMPAIYRSPLADASIPNNETQYLAVRDPRSVFPGAQSVPIQEIIDGTSVTAAVMEVSTQGVLWTQPKDISIDAAYTALTQMTSTDAGQVVVTDGSVRFLSPQTSQQEFEELFIRNDVQQMQEQ